MSLFGSLTTAVSGLNAQSSAIGNISENIANSQTTGFKEVDTSFENFITESTPSFNEPGGVIATPTYQNSTSGTLVSSQIPTSIAISGNGYFAVTPPAGSTSTVSGTVPGDGTYYSRRGDFTVDKNGYLVNGAGYYLDGYAVSGTTTSTTVAPIQVPLTGVTASPTTSVSVTGALPSQSLVSSTSPMTVQVYDSTGTAHQATITFTESTTTPGTWNGSLTVADSTATSGNAASTFTLSFNSSGSPVITAGSNDTASTTSSTAISVPTTLNGTSSSMSFDFAGLTQGSTNTIAGASLVANGEPAGSYKSVSIDSSGAVSVNYDNGYSSVVGKIPLAQFAAPNQLQRMDGSTFAQTQASGTPAIGSVGTNGTGVIEASTLESSNVDISDQFTKLVVAQNAYSANAKVVTTANQLLQTVINMIQA